MEAHDDANQEEQQQAGADHNEDEDSSASSSEEELSEMENPDFDIERSSDDSDSSSEDELAEDTAHNVVTELTAASSEAEECTEECVDAGAAQFKGPVMLLRPDSCRHYNIPSRCTHNQTADALCVLPPRGPLSDEHTAVVVAELHRLTLARLQHTPTPMPPVIGAQMVQPHYSIAVSPDGKFIAASGDNGILMVLGVLPPSEDASGGNGLVLITIAMVSRHGSMNNSVRFGWFAGKLRIIVAAQPHRSSEGHRVYLYNVPEWDGTLEQLPSFQNFLCPDLPPWANQPEQHVQMGQEDAYHLRLVTFDDVTMLIPEHPQPTSVIMHFGSAPNYAEASPDGQWLVVACDEPNLYLVPAHKQYMQQPVQRLPLPLTEAEQQAARGPTSGCQYSRFSCDSKLLAASSDSWQCVYVFSVPTWQVVCRFNCNQPCLALCWSPTDPHLLAWATTRTHVHVVDMRWPSKALTCVSLKAVPKGRRYPVLAPDSIPDAETARYKQLRINGLCFSHHGELLVSTKRQVFSWQLLPHCWSKELHHLYPQPFKAAVRTLLLLALVDRSNGHPCHPSIPSVSTSHQPAVTSSPHTKHTNIEPAAASSFDTSSILMSPNTPSLSASPCQSASCDGSNTLVTQQVEPQSQASGWVPCFWSLPADVLEYIIKLSAEPAVDWVKGHVGQLSHQLRVDITPAFPADAT